MSGIPVADSFFSRPPDTVPASPGRTTSRIGKGIGISWKHYRQALTRGPGRAVALITRVISFSNGPCSFIRIPMLFLKKARLAKNTLYFAKNTACKSANRRISGTKMSALAGKFPSEDQNDRIKQKSKKRGANPLLTGFCLFSSLTFLTRFTILFTQ